MIIIFYICIFKIVTNIIWPQTLWFNFQEKQTKTKLQNEKYQKRNGHESFQSLPLFEFSTKMAASIVKILNTREIFIYVISAEVENS